MAQDTGPGRAAAHGTSASESRPTTMAGRIGPERLDPGLLGILRCPITGEELEEGALDAAPVLISRGAALAYPVRDGVPILLPHEGLPLPA